MKKLLSLMLALVAGVLGTQAQVYNMVGDYLTEVPEAGVEVALQVPNTCPYGTGKFLTSQDNGTNSYSDQITYSCVFTFEATGSECDGHPAYVLKNAKLGKYLAQDPDDGGVHAYVDTPDRAFQFVCLPSVSVTEGGTRDGVRTNEYSEGTFVFSAVDLEDGSPVFMGSYAYPFFSTYYDTNQWYVCKVEQIHGYDAMIAELQVLLPSGGDTYTAGTEPGQVDPALLAQLTKQYDEAMAAVEPTNEACDKMLADIKATLEALLQSRVMPKAGHYYAMMGTAAPPMPCATSTASSRPCKTTRCPPSRTRTSTPSSSASGSSRTPATAPST